VLYVDAAATSAKACLASCASTPRANRSQQGKCAGASGKVETANRRKANEGSVMSDTEQMKISGFGLGACANGFIVTVTFQNDECEIEENYIATDKNHLSTLVSGFIARINVPTHPLKVISKETRQ
jgi:hypothetical protein